MSAAAAGSWNDDYRQDDFSPYDLPEIIEDRDPPFHMAGDFGMARYDAEADRFQSVVFVWTGSEHMEKPTESPTFTTASEATAWLRQHADWLELRRDPAAPESKYETSFCVHQDALVKVEAKCGELGLQLATSPVSYERVISAWGMDRLRSGSDQDTWNNLVARATKAAEAYLWVHIRAPKADKQVVAVARHECGMPVFHTLEGHDDAFWTAERIASIDFHRCDQCGVRHQRTKVFLVRNRDGDIEQYGGACAKHLNLAKMVDDHLRALKALQAFLGGIGSDEEWGFGGSGRDSQRVDPRFALVIADMMIAEHGYVSGTAAYHSNGDLISTKSHVLEAMNLLLGWTKIGSKDWKAAAEKRRLREKLADYPEGRAQELYERAEALIAEKLTAGLSEFTSNLNVAFQTGSLKLLGFLVWLPSALRKVDAAVARRKIEATRHPWTAGSDENATTGAELKVFIDRWYEGSASMLANDIGVKLTVIERALGAPDKALTKALTGKIGRIVPGTWTITHSRSWNGDFGTTFFLTLVRNDGAKILWKTGSPTTDDGYEANEGDELRIISASIGEIPEPYTNPRTGKTFQDGRLINRVRCTRLAKTA